MTYLEIIKQMLKGIYHVTQTNDFKMGVIFFVMFLVPFLFFCWLMEEPVKKTNEDLWKQ